ncbi:MAG: phosphoribosylanthranilate isomerase [Acidobacteriaceae bacterium]|jgi:phosphoribosylanthranilate isomerase
MWIKICGNTNLEDVRVAADAGADAVGFVFAPSPRRISATQISAMMPDLPADLTKIGVFGTQDFDDIVFALHTAGLHGAQLHGELDFSLAERLRREFDANFFLIQTLHWDVNSDPSRAEDRLRDELRAVARHRDIDAVLLDTRTSTASGGTGRTLDWARAKDVLSAEAGKLRIILAGGLYPGNIREAILTLRPWGVDVSSGVESSPGKKHPEFLYDFIRAARFAFLEIEPPPMLPTAVGPV